MFAGYKRAFWGVFFMSFHINIGTVPILPASIGCLILCSGIVKVEEASQKKMNQPAGMALLLAVTNVIMYFWQMPWYWSIPVSYGIIGLIEMLLFSSLFFNSADILRENGFAEDAKRYENKARGYVIVESLLTVGIVVGTSFMLRSVWVVLIGGLAVRIWVMASIHGLKNLFPEDQAAEDVEVAAKADDADEPEMGEGSDEEI